MKSFTITLVVAMVIGLATSGVVFDYYAHNKTLVLFEEYQAAVRGCTTPKLAHYSTGCVRPSQLDRDLWFKPASGRTPEQIKADRDEVNRVAGICMVGDWSYKFQMPTNEGVVSNWTFHYPCNLKAVSTALQEP